MKKQLEEVVLKSTLKIHVIPMGVDPAGFVANTSSEEPGIGPTDHIIMSAGRLIDWKGTIYLIEAMPVILRKVPGAKLRIIGTGPEEKSLRQRVCDLHLEMYIEFKGTVHNEELKRYYHSADVFVLPSINKAGNTEGLGVVLLEAMASGCPVIGSNVGGIPDIITDGENGFLVPERDPAALAEKIVRLLSDEFLGDRFRKNGLRRVREQFSWDIVSGRFSSVYAEIGQESYDKRAGIQP